MMSSLARSLTGLTVALLPLTVVACTVEGGSEPAPDDTFAGAQRPLFDLAGLSCGGGAMDCSPDSAQCFCRNDFAHNNYSARTGAGARGHYLIVSSNLLGDSIREAGNRPAYYENAMNADWQALGATRKADQMMESARKAFSGTAPRWFVLNGISRNAWNSSAAYRAYVGDLVQRLNLTYGRSVLVFSPFWRPGESSANNPAAWTKVGNNARIGVENYLSGAEIKKNGFSEAWCVGMYQQSITWYGKMGVGAARLVLTEHFAQTPAGAQWGRAGVGPGDWERAIKVRTRAARSLPVYGYASYAWAFNQMGIPDWKRRTFQDLYHQEIEGTDISIPSAVPAGSGDGPTDQPPPEDDPAPTPPSPPAPPPTTAQDLMAGGDVLGPGQSRTSSDGRFTFTYQGDGNLVLYQNPGQPIWASNTGGGAPGVAAMQDDGNLVVYDAGGMAVWSSRTYGHPGSYLVVQSDGNTVLYDPGNQPLWATGTYGR